MEALHIRRFHARYHLPPSRYNERARLDHLLRQMLDEALERAVEQAGISPHEIVCIRSLNVPVRLRLSAPDSALILAWGRALADAIRRAVTGYPSPDIVRYTSPVQALADMAAGIARERYTRAWAWNVANVWTLSDKPGRVEAVFELVRALLNQPQAIVAVMRSLAVSTGIQPRALADLVNRIGADQWIELARAALAETGADPAILEAARPPGVAEARRDARRIASSRFARVWTAAAVSLAAKTETRAALAALLILAEEPSALRTSLRARTLVSETADVLHPAAAPPRHEQRETQQPGAERLSTRHEPDYETRAETSQPEELRQRARTRFGGLLFLLGVLEKVDLLSTIEMSMPHRPFRWALHCLATTLVPAEPDDPAVLAFVGLQPEATPPSAEEEDPATDEEQVLCRKWTAQIREHLREMIDEPEPLSFVCYRDAEIVADPGWIEVRLALRDVSTEIRRAGLDLDPGWVPWLGVVVRFVYE